MALPPKFKAFRLAFTGSGASGPAVDSDPEPLHTIEMYLDYTCPFSASELHHGFHNSKFTYIHVPPLQPISHLRSAYTEPSRPEMFNTVYGSVVPRLRSSPLGRKVQLIFRPQIQPWHPSSTLTHEAGVAVSRLAPSRFWDFAAALFAAQREYFDVAVVAETRNATYRRLARLAADSAGLDEAQVYALLEVPDRPGEDGGLNVGNKVTDDLKVLVKMARLIGVHVSPTVYLDGVEAREISSSWTADEWFEWLQKKVA